MKNIKIILIIFVIAIGATDIVIYNLYPNLDFFSQQDNGSSQNTIENQKLFVASLQNASKYEGIWYESINDGVIKKINSNLYSSSSLKKNLPEIKASLNESRDANENILKYLKNAKKYATNDLENQYVELLIQKVTIDKKIYDSNVKMIKEYEKFANRKLSPAKLKVKMREAKQDLIYKNASNQDKADINNKILNLLKNNPDFQKKLESMSINPSFLGKIS